MKVIPLGAEHEPLYCACLEDWSDEIKEGGDRKARWLEKMKARGLRVHVSLDDRGEVGGMIQCVPIEEAFVEGQGLSFIHCIWVHGHKQGRGNFQKRGMGTALLKAAEDDARAAGAKGMAAWGMALPFFMRASWFRKHGYKKADSIGMQVLLWKPFADDARPPRWIRNKKKPSPAPGRVGVTALVNGWCPGMNTAFERAKRAAAEFGDTVEFRAVDTSDRAIFKEWGEPDAIYVDGKGMRMGPPPTFEKIRKTIAKRVKARRL